MDVNGVSYPTNITGGHHPVPPCVGGDVGPHGLYGSMVIELVI